MDKVFYVYAAHGDTPDNRTEAFLSLPATPYEMLDALEKLRLDAGESVQFRIEEFYRLESLAPFLDKQYGLYELNALAQRLAELDDRQVAAFAGLLAMEQTESPLKLPRIIDLSYSTDCCHVVGEALNDSQLGRFLAENGFLPELDALPDVLFELLDFEQLGRRHRHAEKGVIVERTADHPGGYVERHSDLAEVYKTLDLTPKQPDYTILLKVCKGFFDDSGYDSDKTVQLKLPASQEALDTALTALDIWDWREAGWSCLDCRVPVLTEVISDSEEGIDSLNRLAQQLADMGPKDLAAYKALLVATNCHDFHNASLLADTLGKYIFSPQYSSPDAVAKDELLVILGEAEIPQITPYLNLCQYGESLIRRCNGTLTEYGLIERKDGQPIQSMEQLSQQGGMEMG